MKFYWTANTTPFSDTHFNDHHSSHIMTKIEKNYNKLTRRLKKKSLLAVISYSTTTTKIKWKLQANEEKALFGSTMAQAWRPYWIMFWWRWMLNGIRWAMMLDSSQELSSLWRNRWQRFGSCRSHTIIISDRKATCFDLVRTINNNNNGHVLIAFWSAFGVLP